MSSSTKHLAVFAPSFPPAYKGGGPSRSLEAFVMALPAGFEVSVLSADTDHGDAVRLDVMGNRWVDRQGIQVWYASLDRLQLVLKGLMAVRKKRPDFIYFNSFFNLKLTIVPLFIGKLGFWGRTTQLLAPRGEFGSGALARNSSKKQAYISIFRLLRLHRRIIWHATAEHEVEDIKAVWGNNAHVILRANHTLLPSVAREPTLVGDHLRAVFLGRIVEHKGLLIALEALHDFPGAFELDVFGAEEDSGYVNDCKNAASNLPASVVVRFHGPVAPDAVRDVLADFDILLMPTAGENFGHVIAEALSVSCAVAATPTTPWTAILSGGGGYVVSDRTVRRWSELIRIVAALQPREREDLRRQAGRAYDEWKGNPQPSHLMDIVS